MRRPALLLLATAALLAHAYRHGCPVNQRARAHGRSRALVLGAAASRKVRVALAKPLGLVLEDRDGAPGGVYIGEIIESGSAITSELGLGDVLLRVGASDVSRLDVDAVVSIVGDAASPVEMEFLQAAEAEEPTSRRLGAKELFSQISLPFMPRQRPPETPQPEPVQPASVAPTAGTEPLAGDALQARIDFLKQRERELEQTIREEEVVVGEGGAAGPDVVDDTLGEDLVTIRLPADVSPGKLCAATLPSGVQLQFTAPMDAVPGMLVRVTTSLGDATGAQQQQRAAEVAEEEEAAEETEEEEEEEVEKAAVAEAETEAEKAEAETAAAEKAATEQKAAAERAKKEEVAEREAEKEAERAAAEKEAEQIEAAAAAAALREKAEAASVTEPTETGGENAALAAADAQSATGEAAEGSAQTGAREGAVGGAAPYAAMAPSDPVSGDASPQVAAASKALGEGDLGKALLTSIFGESKADRTRSPPTAQSLRVAWPAPLARHPCFPTHLPQHLPQHLPEQSISLNDATSAVAAALAGELRERREAKQAVVQTAAALEATAAAATEAEAAARTATVAKEVVDSRLADAVAAKEAADSVAAEKAQADEAAAAALAEAKAAADAARTDRADADRLVKSAAAQMATAEEAARSEAEVAALAAERAAAAAAAAQRAAGDAAEAKEILKGLSV